MSQIPVFNILSGFSWEYKIFFILFSFLKDSFTVHKVLGWHLFSFKLRRYYSGLQCCYKKSASVYFYLYEVILSCLYFKVFLSLMLFCFIAMCLGVLFFLSCLIFIGFPGAKDCYISIILENPK